MSSEKSQVEFIVDQIVCNAVISFRKMFGEYAIYYNNKVVALVCDNQLFVKPTTAGQAFIGAINEAPPYPGAKMYFLIEDKIDNSAWLSELINLTANELPEPKIKKPKKK